MIPFQVRTVGTRPVIIAIDPRARHQLDQILIATIVLCQYYQVIAAIVALFPHLVFLAPASHIHFATEYWLKGCKPIFLPLLVDLSATVGKLFNAKHDTVISDGHASHSILNGLADKIRHLGLAVKNGIMRVDVQMYKVFHRFQFSRANVDKKNVITAYSMEKLHG